MHTKSEDSNQDKASELLTSEDKADKFLMKSELTVCTLLSHICQNCEDIVNVDNISQMCQFIKVFNILRLNYNLFSFFLCKHNYKSYRYTINTDILGVLRNRFRL